MAPLRRSRRTPDVDANLECGRDPAGLRATGRPDLALVRQIWQLDHRSVATRARPRAPLGLSHSGRRLSRGTPPTSQTGCLSSDASPLLRRLPARVARVGRAW